MLARPALLPDTPRRDALHAAALPAARGARARTLPEQVLQPHRRAARALEQAAIPDAPPPEVADDRAGDAARGACAALGEEVDADHDEGEVAHGEGDHAEEGGHRGGGRELGGEVDERHEPGARVHEGLEGEVQELRGLSVSAVRLRRC